MLNVLIFLHLKQEQNTPPGLDLAAYTSNPTHPQPTPPFHVKPPLPLLVQTPPPFPFLVQILPPLPPLFQLFQPQPLKHPQTLTPANQQPTNPTQQQWPTDITTQHQWNIRKT